MKIVCAFGQHNYGDPVRGTSYEYANFLPALRSLGHDVIHFETWNKSRYPGFVDLNRAFLETIAAVQPDVILCVMVNYELWLETLQDVQRKCRAVMLHWGTDDTWKYEPFARWVAPAFDLYATTSQEAFDRAKREGHQNFLLTQWAANGQALNEPLAARDCQYQVTFVGSAYGNRPRWISRLKKSGIDVICFGYGWKNGPVASEEIPKIIRHSVVSLNFGDSGLVLGGSGIRRSRQIKARIFEVPGAGGFLLTQDAPHLDQYYDAGKEIAIFDGISDLQSKIEYFLAHPEQRDAIAQSGHARTTHEHTYVHRFGHLLAVAAELHASKTKNGAPSSYVLNNPWFSSVVERHYVGFTLRLLRQLLVMPFTLFFGKVRGARAARRLVYEFSWRVSRSRTYTSAGLPGRMFYKES